MLNSQLYAAQQPGHYAASDDASAEEQARVPDPAFRSGAAACCAALLLRTALRCVCSSVRRLRCRRLAVAQALLAEDGEEARRLAAAQGAWLDRELESLRSATREGAAEAEHVFVFTHISPFVNTPDEPTSQ